MEELECDLNCLAKIWQEKFFRCSYELNLKIYIISLKQRRAIQRSFALFLFYPSKGVHAMEEFNSQILVHIIEVAAEVLIAILGDEE